jgi:hypothetical protein
MKTARERINRPAQIRHHIFWCDVPRDEKEEGHKDGRKAPTQPATPRSLV